MARRSGRKTKPPDMLDPVLSIRNDSPQVHKNKRPPKRNFLTLSNALHANSPILKANIQSLFAAAVRNWPDLPEDRKTRLIDAFPPTYRLYNTDERGKLRCPVSEKFVANDSIIKRDTARFKRDVKNGFYLKKWQEDGKNAMRDRAKGHFDEYRVQLAEDSFGQMRGAQEDQTKIEVAD